MAQSQKVEAMLKPKVEAKLGLWGAALNAMALIAPGAFLWITFQLQAAATAPAWHFSGQRYIRRDCGGSGGRFFNGIVLRPAGEDLSGSRLCELRVLRRNGRFLDKRKEEHSGLVSCGLGSPNWRLAGAAHLFYWVYPGVMVSFYGDVDRPGFTTPTPGKA